jgi:phosphoribosylanthranilate isomerase
MVLERIKICCIKSRADVDLMSGLGKVNLGIGHGLDSPGHEVDLQMLARYCARTGDNSVLVTSATASADIVRLVRFIQPSAIQLANVTDPGVVAAVKRHLPSLDLIAAVYVEGESSLAAARAFFGVSDYLLLDTPDSGTHVKGGTGRTHDWGISRRIALESPLPTILAGGLTPANVAEAIAKVEPWGVDVCSGVRRDDELDKELARTFLTRCEALGAPQESGSR